MSDAYATCPDPSPLLARADIPLEGPQDPTAECDALSVGFGFYDYLWFPVTAFTWADLAAPPLVNRPGSTGCLCP